MRVTEVLCPSEIFFFFLKILIFHANPSFSATFGGTSTAGGGLFGTTQTQGTSLFGASTKPSLFGSTATTSTATAGGFGGFGTATSTGTGGLFGANNQAKVSVELMLTILLSNV